MPGNEPMAASNAQPGNAEVSAPPSTPENLQAMIVDRSLVIGQAMACGLPAPRLERAKQLHAATVEHMTNKDPKARKLRDEMIELGRKEEQELGNSRCDVIELAFLGLEKVLARKNGN